MTLGVHCPVKVAASHPLGPHLIVATPPLSHMATHMPLKGVTSVQEEGQTPLPTSRFGGGMPGQVLSTVVKNKMDTCSTVTVTTAGTHMKDCRLGFSKAGREATG